jgi:hypothetical protein
MGYRPFEIVRTRNVALLRTHLLSEVGKADNWEFIFAKRAFESFGGPLAERIEAGEAPADSKF